MLPPLELVIDHLGRRCVPLASLQYVLEAAAEEEGASLALLLAACERAAEAPLPGVTPPRADQPCTAEGAYWTENAEELGLRLAEPVAGPGGYLLHPGARDDK